MVNNTFGKEIKEIKDIVDDPICRAYIGRTLGTIFSSIGINESRSIKLIGKIFAYAEQNQFLYEYKARGALEKAAVTERLPSALEGRSQLIYDQVKPYVVGSTVLDLGCGDGKVGELLADDGLEVTLADIYQHHHVPIIGLPFRLVRREVKLSLGQQYDTTLLLTVLHHSDDPLQTLNTAVQATRQNGRIIVIESVYNIEDQTDFGRLTPDQQFAVNIFFDHFYNRIIHYNDNPYKKVNVPFNFNSPDQWKRIFESKGLRQDKVIYLGIDQALVPEYHTLHVLQK
ncbi:methyltransferase domain-containing protein [Candidatus Woesearchaeota archaeon]|nr:methyltransferase domain-containing protein [Candidatus Woesearchaeota archaeon]